MDEGGDFMDLLELQGDLQMITKSELLENVRKRGGSISDRQLTSYVTEGLLPKSARIGSRSGAYPKIVERLVLFVTQARRRGLSVQGVKELLPVWRLLESSRLTGELQLDALEYVAREHAVSAEAAYSVPWMINAVLPCPSCDPERFQAMKFVKKDGELMEKPVTIGFVLAHQNSATGDVERLSSMRIAMPMRCEGEYTDSVVLGIPNGVELPSIDEMGHEGDQRTSVVSAGEGEAVEEGD